MQAGARLGYLDGGTFKHGAELLRNRRPGRAIPACVRIDERERIRCGEHETDAETATEPCRSATPRLEIGQVLRIVRCDHAASAPVTWKFVGFARPCCAWRDPIEDKLPVRAKRREGGGEGAHGLYGGLRA